MAPCTEELLRKQTFKYTLGLIKTLFYRDLLSVWCDIAPSSNTEFLNEPLFHNDILIIDKKIHQMSLLDG